MAAMAALNHGCVLRSGPLLCARNPASTSCNGLSPLASTLSVLPIAKQPKKKESIMRNSLTITSTFALLLFGAACGHDDDHGHDHENEVITTVVLAFTPTAGGSTQEFEFNDSDGDGGDAPIIDDVSLAAGAYTLEVSFENRLESPAEDITEEVEDESDEHQLFFTGSAVNGDTSDNVGAPLEHSYADEDGDGNPIGLVNTIDAAVGNGELTVILRHLPPVGDAPAKVSDLAEQVRNGMLGTIGGSTDVQVTFPISVQATLTNGQSNDD